MDRKTLRVILGCLATFGVLIGSVPFVRSLLPTDRVRQSAMHIFDVSRLNPGEYRVERINGRVAYIVHKPDQTWRVFAFDERDGKVPMPDVHWWRRSGYSCADFGLTTTNGKVTATSRFRCADPIPEYWEWYFSVWQWDIDGHIVERAGSPVFEDLPRPQFEQRNDHIYILRGL